MIEAELLAYDHDEERNGFGEPPRATAPPESTPDAAPRSGTRRFALGLVALGALSLVIQTAGGPLAGTWLGFLSSFGALGVGGALAFWLAREDRPPGIDHNGIWFRSLLARGGAAWMAGIAMTGFYVLVYWYPHVLGHPGDGGEPSGLVRVVAPLARVATGAPASQWFMYGVLYTLAIAVFGMRMFVKYRHNRYQLARTTSVILFQFAFAWLLPNVLVRLRQPYMEFNGIWPLKYDYLWPSKVMELRSAEAVGTFLLVWAVAAALIATPVLTYFWGKRWYCSWVCGCGGLAETVGDPWRQLASTSTRAWKLERWTIHSVLVLVVAATAIVWADHAWGLFGSVSYPLRQAYGFWIGAVFSGVVGVGFYPLLGSRVWCRFGCPQAAILGLIQRVFSRFRITTNGGQCMSCGNCSTYCEMGIDVRAYAERNENIVRASCVGCGVCAAVCPRGALRLENGLPGDRFEGSDDPWRTLRESFETPSIHGYEAWNSATPDAPGCPAPTPRGQ